MSTIDRSDQTVHRVRALIAKAESSEFPHEAEAFLAKAQELMTRHAIDDARLRRAGVGPQAGVIDRIVSVDPPYATARTSLLGAVARNNHCRVVITRRFDAGRECHVLGYPYDVEMVVALFASLSGQAIRTMPPTPLGDAPKRFRHAFLLAYAARVGERLRAAALASRAAVEHRTGRTVELALRDRRDAVDRAVVEKFPFLIKARRPSVSSGAGIVSGRAAADRARLGQTELARHRALPPATP